MFCEKPFEQFEIDENGNVDVCCFILTPLSKQVLFLGNLIQNTPADVWNSRIAQEVRKSILDNSFKFCSKELCGFLKYKHLPAFEEVTNPFHKEIISKQLIVLDKGPQTLVFKYDATCNLRCPSCRTNFISFKGKEFKKAQLIQSKILRWDFKDIKRVLFSSSGDPFASKLCREVLQSLDIRKYPQLRITILTNGILLTPAMWNSLHKIHQGIDAISVSIDAATEETYNIVRIGGDFSKLLKNLFFIGNLRKNDDISFFEINFVVQKANYQEMKAFIGLGTNFNCDRVHFTPIQNIGAHTKEEYSEVAVHDKFHPEYKSLLKILEDPVFKEPVVSLDNLEDLSIYSEAALRNQNAKIQADVLFKEREVLVNANEHLAEENKRIRDAFKEREVPVNANEHLAEENKRIRNAFLTSRSWKITAFLRAIHRMTGYCLDKRVKKPFFLRGRYIKKLSYTLEKIGLPVKEEL